MASSWMRRASRSAFGFAGRKTGTGPFSGIMATLSFLRRIGVNPNGGVAELAYAADLKSAAARLVGSSPTAPTKEERGFQAGFDLWRLRVGRDSNR